MIPLEKEDLENLYKDIERVADDELIGGFSHIDFRDYESHKQEIDSKVAELGLTDKIKITYESFGITIDRA